MFNFLSEDEMTLQWKNLKHDLWYQYFGNKENTKCPLYFDCNHYIEKHYFDCGHKFAKCKTGNDTLNNLIPLCHYCNIHMSSTSYYDYRDIKLDKYYDEHKMDVDHSIRLKMNWNIVKDIYKISMVLSNDDAKIIILNINLDDYIIYNFKIKEVQSKCIKDVYDNFKKIDVMTKTEKDTILQLCQTNSNYKYFSSKEFNYKTFNELRLESIYKILF